MRRFTAIALLLACAGLAGSLLYRCAVEPPCPPGPPAKPAQLLFPKEALQSTDWDSGQLSRETAAADLPDQPTAGVDPVIAVRAHSQTGLVRGGEVRLVVDGGSLQTQPLDDNGTAVFRLGSGSPEQVIVRVPGYVAVSRKLDSPEAQVVDVYLLQAGTLRVRLLDGTGRLLPNRHVQSHATARVRSEPPNEIHKRCSSITNEYGVALLENVPPGQHEVTVFEYSHWNDAILSSIEVYAGQVTDVTLTAKEKEQSTYAGVLFPAKTIPNARFTDTGEVRGYRLFYKFQGGKGERHSWLVQEWGQGFVAVVPAPTDARLTAFLAECDDKEPIRPGSRRTNPFEIVVGATITCIPEWEK